MSDPTIALAEKAIAAKSEFRAAMEAVLAACPLKPNEIVRTRHTETIESDFQSFSRMVSSEPFSIEGAAKMIEAVAHDLKAAQWLEYTFNGRCRSYTGHPLIIEVLRRVKEGLDNLALQGSQVRTNHRN